MISEPLAQAPDALGPAFLRSSAHNLREISAFQAGEGPGLGNGGIAVARALPRNNYPGKRALLTNVPGEPPGINVGNGDHALAQEKSFKAFLSAEVRHSARALANHQPRRPDAIRFAVLRIAARIANLRIGEGHDLLSVGGIGEDLLVPRHGGVKYHFSSGDPFGAKGNSRKEAAIFEGEEGWLSHMRPLFLCFTHGARSFASAAALGVAVSASYAG